LFLTNNMNNLNVLKYYLQVLNLKCTYVLASSTTKVLYAKKAVFISLWAHKQIVREENICLE